ncbi:malate dehydrogenase (quinone) [Corynebacteriales bacterium D3-21]|uniref:Probable malate:quinone oxidoreductase n=1 Tax=Speluncibacter jeojiensis TaxID=2710754 RepID=A0A9X4RCV3_9ACTN|nr:malate dehydrogenase (quinone) [Rhodococcus sp. D2-41]MDG3013939.1 malate dehydrogenase (quinone) [Corynebacteriales bacterium D3-21]
MPQKTDVVLVGAGIMSATLGVLLRRLQPEWSITVLERLDAAAAESSDPWNNAGTGHSALCELNYTPQKADGTVDITKAVNVNEQFQVSRQFWSYAVENGILPAPREFINPIPHISFVHGGDDVKYLRARYDALAKHPLFAGMEYSEDEGEFGRRLPLMAAGRDYSDPVAINWFEGGTDVDFGALTRQLLAHLGKSGATIGFGQQVTNLTKQSNGDWRVAVKNVRTHERKTIDAKFVFVGAGGGALALLQRSGIAEAKGFGGFPVSGEFLRCTNESLIGLHQAKVYGKAAVGAPPMSVPHLDTRVIAGKPGLLFGPYAGWSPKFLKNGKITDLPLSVKPNNLLSMLGVGVTEMGLTKYLIGELMQSPEDRIGTLSQFVPEADIKDWELITAGQRVQVIRRKKGKGGVLEFGTAVVNAEDGSIAGLLGASPGASTAVPAMLDVLQKCFPADFQRWQPALKEMVPSLGTKLSGNPALFDEVWQWSSKTLELNREPVRSA